MSVSTEIKCFPGVISSIREVRNLTELIEYILPYSIAKIYLTANRRWSFLEKNRRNKALALLINRIIRRFAFNIWDVRAAGGGFIEDFHTMPIIGIINILATEYAKQENMITESAGLNLATFKLCGNGYISADLKSSIDKLYMLKMLKEHNSRQPKPEIRTKPYLYEEAVNSLYELEESLIRSHNKISRVQNT
ncbi:hypothetical protein ACMC5R_00340 [Deferribacteres bacterium DY0037]|nr:hypothetical protein [Denitrovibrio acetiphilus]